MFKITRDMIKAKGAFPAGYREFCKTFPEEDYPDGVEYQKILDRCAENGRDSYASWLVYTFGKTTDVRKIEGDYISEKSIFVCGRLEVTGKISCIGRIEAGDSIKAGCGIEAGDSIKAGCGIEAGWDIEAGCDIKAGRGIEAGWGIKAGWGIEAGDSIKAGRGIEAGDSIKADENFGIYAGLSVRLDSNDRQVKAKQKPINLICGEFVVDDDKE